MAQQNSSSEKADPQAAHTHDNDNPQLLNSEIAKAFEELAQGERTASALESKLDDIESRIDQLIASLEENLKQKSRSSGLSKSK